MDAQQIRKLKPKLRRFLKQFDECFPRKDTRAHLPVYISGQLSDIPEKSVEPIAINAGVPPRTLQEFLSQHHWDHDRARDQLQHIVRDEHSGPHSIGILDETSDVKKGDKTPGVKRQWCGAVGKKENCIVTVHLTYARDGFHTLIDGELYLPKSWSDDRARCREAGIPDDMVYRPKWKIGLELYDRAIGNGLHFDWMTFDEGYGSKPELLRTFRPAISGSWVKCRVISGAGSKHRGSSREPSANTAAAAAARRPVWPVAVRCRDASTRCSIRTGFATSPGSSGGSRTGIRDRWSGRSSTCDSTPSVNTVCLVSHGI